MDFKEWLVKNWDELRSKTKNLSGDDHKDILNNLWWVDYSHEMPCDSWDRLFALYIIDEHSEIIGKPWKEVESLDFMQSFKNEKSDFSEGAMAYNNYEREWISNEEAYNEMMAVIKKGRERVLEDSADDYGWFGAA